MTEGPFELRLYNGILQYRVAAEFCGDGAGGGIALCRPPQPTIPFSGWIDVPVVNTY